MLYFSKEILHSFKLSFVMLYVYEMYVLLYFNMTALNWLQFKIVKHVVEKYEQRQHH